MTAGLREEMSRVLGVQSKSTISDNCADVVFLYQNYGDFSGDIEYLYTEIVNRRANQLMSRSLVLRLLLCVHGVKSNKYVISFFIFACFIVTNMLLL